MNSQCQKLFVAAIDFGTTYSGFALSATSDCCKVLTSNWSGGKLVSLKTPTAILLDEETKCVAFGYEAEDKYIELARDEEHEPYYFFHRFKMMLHTEKLLHRKTMCKDARGKELAAKIVFSRSIEYFKDSLMKQLKNSYPEIQLSDVQFILTVPAIWDDRSKQFMREAAVEAGLDKKWLKIALEPEAASIYSQYTPDDGIGFMSEHLGVVDTGTKYMVLDLGGGTADITVHLKAADGSLEELSGASGGPWGGKKVDDEFELFLSEIIGEENMKEFKTEYLEDHIELMRNFESKKRHIDASQEGNIHLSVPFMFIDLIKKDKNLKGLEKAINNSKNAGKVSFENHKLKFEKSVFREFFTSTISEIIEHLVKIFKDENVKDVDIILMVGGFSDCSLVQKAVKDKFSGKRVIVPADAGIAVLKGAVYYGHVPDIISRRAARYTYGIQSWPEYNPMKHKEGKKVKLGESLRCRDVFFKYVSKGQRITPGFRKSQIFQVLKPDETSLQCVIYVSDKPDPMYIDEPGCRPLGVLTIPLPDIRRGTSMELEETMIFGETELRVQARDIYTNQFHEVTLDLLGDDDL